MKQQVLTRSEKTKIIVKALFRLKRPLVAISVEAIKRGDFNQKHFDRITDKGNSEQCYSCLKKITPYQITFSPYRIFDFECVSDDTQINLAKRFIDSVKQRKRFLENLGSIIFLFGMFGAPILVQSWIGPDHPRSRADYDPMYLTGIFGFPIFSLPYILLDSWGEKRHSIDVERTKEILTLNKSEKVRIELDRLEKDYRKI